MAYDAGQRAWALTGVTDLGERAGNCAAALTL